MSRRWKGVAVVMVVLCLGISAGILYGKIALERRILAMVNGTHISVLGVPTVLTVAHAGVNPLTGRISLDDVHFSVPSEGSMYARNITAYGIPGRFILAFAGIGRIDQEDVYIPHVVINEPYVEDKNTFIITSERMIFFETFIRTSFIEGIIRGEAFNTNSLEGDIVARGFEFESVQLLKKEQGQPGRTLAEFGKISSQDCAEGHIGNLMVEHFSTAFDENRVEVGVFSIRNFNMPDFQKIADITAPQNLERILASVNGRELLDMFFFGESPLFDHVSVAGVICHAGTSTLSLDMLETVVDATKKIGTHLRGLKIIGLHEDGLRLPGELRANADFIANYAGSDVISDSHVEVPDFGRFSYHGVQRGNLLEFSDMTFAYEDHGGLAWVASNLVDSVNELQTSLKSMTQLVQAEHGEHPETLEVWQGIQSFIERPGIIVFSTKPGAAVSMDNVQLVFSNPGHWLTVNVEEGTRPLVDQVADIYAQWNETHK